MTINIVEAEVILDNELSPKAVQFLLAARDGLAFHDADEGMFKKLNEKGLVEVIPFDHPRAKNAINGIVLSENGVKVANVIDNRHWAEPDTPLESPAAEADTSVIPELRDAQEVPKGVERVAEDRIPKAPEEEFKGGGDSGANDHRKNDSERTSVARSSDKGGKPDRK